MRELYTANLFWLDFSQLWIESAKSSGLHCAAVLVFSCDENLYRRRSFTSGLRGTTSQESCCVDRKEASKKVLTSATEDSFSASFMSCVQKTALILIRIYDQEKSFTWLWLAFQILPRIRIPAQDPVSVQPSEAPECLLDRWAAIYEDPRKSSSYSNGCKKKNGHWFKAKIWTHELCTYHPMFQFVDWKKLFSLESKCTTNPKCKRISWNG